MTLPVIRFKNINELFSHHITQPFDRNFLNKMLSHVDNFIRKDENTINFFGGNLIGVYPVKWTSDDKLLWIEDILQVEDYDKLVTDIYNLHSINKSWIISSDAINLSFLWVAHQALKTNLLSDKDKEHLARASINMLQYKFISSIHTHFFKYRSNMDTALAVYESLDNKFQLKRCGSWKGLIDNRTDNILGEDKSHSKTIKLFEDDEAIVKMINDIWNRLKSIMKILTSEFKRISLLEAKITASSKYTEVDGVAILKDSVNKYLHIKTSMHNLIPDKTAFIREDVLSTIGLTISTVYVPYLTATLTYISENYNIKNKHIDLPELIEEILMFSFSVIRKEKLELKDITSISLKLRGILRSSRVVSPEYKVIKNKIATIVELSNHRISEVNMSSTRIAVILYIILRALLYNK
jgi:hypothetical protein